MFLEVGDFLEEKRQTPPHASRTSSSIGLGRDAERHRVAGADNKVHVDTER